MDILDLLASDNYIPYNRTLAKEIGIEPAILFGALCGYQRHYKTKEFYREQSNIIEDTCLTEYSIRQSTKVLQEKGLIIVTKKGLPAKNYYQINTIKLMEYIRTSGCEIDTTRDNETNMSCDIEKKSTNNKINNKIKDNNINIAQSNNVANEPALYKLQLNDNSYFEVTQSFYDELKPLYPAVDLDNEFRQMISWIIGNPNKRKTKLGIKRFITTWLSREQDKGRNGLNRDLPENKQFIHNNYTQDQLKNLITNLDEVEI